MTQTIVRAPRIGRRLLVFLTSYEEDHAASGDCGEEFVERVRAGGRLRALLWYWSQILHALGAYTKLSFLIGAAMLKNYLKITWRNIRNHKLYSFINIMGLAVGMACCILILLWVQDELSYDRFHENFENLYTTNPEMEGTRYNSNPLALAPTLRENYPEIVSIARFTDRTWLAKYGDRLFNEDGGLVDEDFLKMFTFPLLEGSPDTVFVARESIVISERMAAKFFGSEDPMGKSMLINGRTELVVTGILEDIPANSHLQFDFLSPIKLMGDREFTSWSWEARTYLLLKENADWQDFAGRIFGFVNEHDKRTDQEVLLHMRPLSRIHLYALRGTDPIVYIYIFLIIALAILIIACINFINLSTARSNTRAKEIGLRKVVGAEKSHIVRQFLGESLLFAAVALVLALGLILLLLPAFNRLADKQMTLDVAGNLTLLLVLAGILLFTGLVSGSYPAFLLSTFRPTQTLKGEYRSSSRGYVLRKILVVSQFTATIVLIIGTILIYRQLEYIRNRDLGLDREHVVAVTLGSELRQNYRSFKEAVKQHPGVIDATAARRFPTNIAHMNPVYWEGRGPEQYVTMTDASVDFDYFETLGMEIVRGRSFSEAYPTDAQNYVLNETAAAITGLDSPVGKRFSVWEDEGQVIGIVRDFHSRSLHTPIGPVVFTLSQRHGSHQYMFVKLRSDSASGTLGFLEEKAGEFAPNSVFEYQFLDDVFDAQYRIDQRWGSIYSSFTFLAIFISCLGLFGMASFTAEQRTKEIGIRKVLGASVSNVLVLIAKDFLLLLAVSNLIAWPVAYILMDRLLGNYAYRTGIALWVFAVSGIAVAFLALLTVCFKIARAAHVDPVESLRHE